MTLVLFIIKEKLSIKDSYILLIIINLALAF
jgi:hypothetical protein